MRSLVPLLIRAMAERARAGVSRARDEAARMLAEQSKRPYLVLTVTHVVEPT